MLILKFVLIVGKPLGLKSEEGLKSWFLHLLAVWFSINYPHLASFSSAIKTKIMPFVLQSCFTAFVTVKWDHVSQWCSNRDNFLLRRHLTMSGDSCAYRNSVVLLASRGWRPGMLLNKELPSPKYQWCWGWETRI